MTTKVHCPDCGQYVEDLEIHRVMAHGWGKEDN